MNRPMPFVLLLAGSVVLAGERPWAQRAGGTAGAQPVETTPVQGPAEQVQAGADAAQPGIETAPGEGQGPQGPPEEAPAEAAGDGTLISVPGSTALGMSILGNQDAPTSLVIVPWKTSELGGAPGIAPMLDDSRQPVDRDVFMRSLRYYEIRSETKP